jgi:hypothetical protein
MCEFENAAKRTISISVRRNDAEIGYTAQANISMHHKNTLRMILYRFCFFM